MSRAIRKLQDANFNVYGLANGGNGSIFDLETGRERYSLKVPFEYSPDTISAAIIVDRNGIWVINTAMIMYVARYPFIKEPTKKKESDNCP